MLGPRALGPAPGRVLSPLAELRTLRERGVTLAGPDPRTLVDEVPAAVLRARMRSHAREFLPDMLGVTRTLAFAEYAQAQASGAD